MTTMTHVRNSFQLVLFSGLLSLTLVLGTSVSVAHAQADFGYTSGGYGNDYGYTSGGYGNDYGYTSGGIPNDYGYSSGIPNDYGYTSGGIPNDYGYTSGIPNDYGYTSGGGTFTAGTPETFTPGCPGCSTFTPGTAETFTAGTPEAFTAGTPETASGIPTYTPSCNCYTQTPVATYATPGATYTQTPLPTYSSATYGTAGYTASAPFYSSMPTYSAAAPFYSSAPIPSASAPSYSSASQNQSQGQSIYSPNTNTNTSSSQSNPYITTSSATGPVTSTNTNTNTNNPTATASTGAITNTNNASTGPINIQNNVNVIPASSQPQHYAQYTFPAPSCTISASSGYTYGYYNNYSQPITLTWSSTNATSAYITPSVGTVAPSGSTTVYPSGYTTYTMTISGPGGTATCQATSNYASPTYSAQYIAPAPVYQNASPAVSLTQIPYTGFDYGPVGNAIYWMSLLALAAAAAYLMVYYRGGALALAGSVFGRTGNPRDAYHYDEVEEEIAPVATPVVAAVAEPALEETIAHNELPKIDYSRITSDSMIIDHSGAPRIVIARA